MNTFEKTTKKDYWVCDSCNITSQTKSRMIPCPRGNCEAKVKGEIITTVKVNLFEESDIVKKFDENDWDFMNGCVLHATWNTAKKSCSREELAELFTKLPEGLKGEAREWGMADTLWRDKFIAWYEQNCL